MTDSLANYLGGGEVEKTNIKPNEDEYYMPEKLREDTQTISKGYRNFVNKEVLEQSKMPVNIKGSYILDGKTIKFNTVNSEFNLEQVLTLEGGTSEDKIKSAIGRNIKSIKIDIKKAKSLLSANSKPSFEINGFGSKGKSGELVKVLIKYFVTQYKGEKYLQIVNGDLGIGEEKILQKDYFNFIKKIRKNVKSINGKIDITNEIDGLIPLNQKYFNENIELTEVSIPGSNFEKKINLNLNITKKYE